MEEHEGSDGSPLVMALPCFELQRYSPLDKPLFIGRVESITMDDFQFGLNELFVGKM
jgi:hypothetical protein